MPAEISKISISSPPPLRKKNLQQQVYTRFQRIEDKLSELLALPKAEILTRSRILDKEDSGYIPSECLVHLLRTSRKELANKYFEDVYNALLSRILLRLRAGTNTDSTNVALKEYLIRDKVLDRFNKFLIDDRTAYEEKLDFYEVCFDKTLKCLILDAKKQVYSETNRFRPLDNSETCEISVEVEKATGSFDPFDKANSNEKDYLILLDLAINRLPPDQKRVVTMLKLEIPISSKDPEAVTIAKTLKKSEKTIRTIRDKAFASIRTFFKKELHHD